MARERTEHTPQVAVHHQGQTGLEAHGPAVVITRRAADRLRAGHLWVYRSDVQDLIPREGKDEIAPGAVVAVVDSRSIPLGSGLYSSASQIAVRMVSREAKLTREGYLAEVAERLRAALALRDELAPSSRENDSCRLVFAEADGLPGIVADRYNDLVILQLLTQGTAQPDLRETLVTTLREHLGEAVSAIVERPDPKIRELEELAAPSQEPLYAKAGAKLTTVFTINGTRF